MNILYNCDDSYVQHMAVSAASVFAHNREAKEIRVYLLGKDISLENRGRLMALARQYGRQITILPLSQFETKVRSLAGEAADAGRFTMTAFARLFAAELLPESVGRLLYLDCDTVVAGSLQALWETDLQGCAAAMAMEPTIYPEARANCGLSETMPYCNAGVILMDLNAFRREQLAEQCMAFLKERGGRLPFADQDCLNHALRGRVRILPQQYNFLSNYRYFSYKSLARRVSWFRAQTDETSWNEAKRHPLIIHFAGDERPWIAGNWNPYRKVYCQMLAETPWQNAPEVQGKRGYLFCYHLMNLMTAVLPSLRFQISARYWKKQIAPFYQLEDSASAKGRQGIVGTA